ncbi:MAG: 50S ribosomal protein L5 [Candidatus Woesearchaeota archaeon]|jgi:large subunit ribosomal protein L5
MSNKENVMRNIRIGKVTLNLGAGKDIPKLEKGQKLFKILTGVDSVKTITHKRIQQWGLRPGLPIGCKVTLRGEEAKELIMRLLTAKDFTLSERSFDNEGNFAFGIHEYIEIANFDYIPEIGLLGFEVCVSLERPGFRVKKRRMKQAKVGKKHRISKQDSIEFAKLNLSVKIKEELV